MTLSDIPSIKGWLLPHPHQIIINGYLTNNVFETEDGEEKKWHDWSVLQSEALAWFGEYLKQVENEEMWRWLVGSIPLFLEFDQIKCLADYLTAYPVWMENKDLDRRDTRAWQTLLIAAGCRFRATAEHQKSNDITYGDALNEYLQKGTDGLSPEVKNKLGLNKND